VGLIVGPLVFSETSTRILDLASDRKNQCSDPLGTKYWSVTPYKLGKGAVKYMTMPRADGPSVATIQSGDQLRTAMKTHLQTRDAYFDFCVQPRVDATEQPIEDATRLWRSSPQKVATIHIPCQSFDSPEQMEFCENISFSPWQALGDHRPLGSMNRTRKQLTWHFLTSGIERIASRISSRLPKPCRVEHVPADPELLRFYTISDFGGREMPWKAPQIAVCSIGFLHVLFMVGELLPWNCPLIMSLVLRKWPRQLDLSLDDRHFVSMVVHNAGIYNGIVAAGLFAAASGGAGGLRTEIALLTGGIVAGVFGFATLTRETISQAFFGTIALVIVVWCGT